MPIYFLSKYMCLMIVFLFCLIYARGLFNSHLLAGHDATAYPVTLHQFHENIVQGILYPVWAPDMRYGYGHPKLQFRPPLLQYIAEIIYITCGNLFLSINLTVALFVFLAGFGMFFWCKRFMHEYFALISACAFLSYHYFLADIYLRGAYYEFLAIACMPWILWAQTKITDISEKISITSLIVCSLSFTAIWCSHPAVAVFFMALSFAYALFMQKQNKSLSPLIYYFLCIICGLLIAAPYVYVSFKEFNFVRLNLFFTEYRSFSQNFMNLSQLFFEKWPLSYIEFRGQEHPEMRGLNLWAICILMITPVTWFISSCQSAKQTFGQIQRSQFFFSGILISIFMCLSLSLPVWELCSILQTFNFPWRALTVTGLCMAVCCGLCFEFISKFFKWQKKTILIFMFIVLIFMLMESAPHTAGWPGVSWMTSSELTSESIQKHSGIPDQFYTPYWVKNYARSPATSDIIILSGKAHVRLIKKTPVKWNIQVDAKTPCEIAVSHYYYPGWQISMDSQKPKQPGISPLKGLMTFHSPIGKHHFELSFTKTKDRILSYLMAILGFLGLGGMIMLNKINKTAIVVHQK